MEKECKKCHKILDISKFNKHPQTVDGHIGTCKQCESIENKEYHLQHRDRIIARVKDYYENNKEHVANYKKEWYRKNKEKIKNRTKNWYEANKETILERKRTRYTQRKEIILEQAAKYRSTEKGRETKRRYEQNRLASDLNYKISRYLRGRINSAIRGNYKTGSAVSDLGCSIDEFKEYIQSKFQEGMSWDNWGREKDNWHLDHIIPLTAFDLTNREEFLKATHYTNFQPIWSTDNLEKHTKIVVDLEALSITSSHTSVGTSFNNISRVDLTHLYSYCGLSYKEIANKYNVSISAVFNKIKEYGIINHIEEILTKENLVTMIVHRRMKIPQISKETGITESSISRYVRMHGLSSSWHTYYNTNKLQELSGLGLSYKQIAELINLPRESVKSLYKTKGISTNLKHVGQVIDIETVRDKIDLSNLLIIP